MFKKIIISVVTALILMSAGCRPPELEGAFVEFNGGRYDNALESALAATEKYPANEEAWFLLGKIYGKKDQIANMVEAFDKSLSLKETHKADIEKEKEYYFANKFNAGVSSFQAFQKMEDKDSEDAKKRLEQSIKNFQESNMIKEDYRAVRLTAISYEQLGETEKAIENYLVLTELNPDTADAWNSLGRSYFYKKDYDKAIEYFSKAFEVDSTDSESITFLAQTYDMLKRKDDAIEAYKKAVELNPEEKALPFNLGLLMVNSSNAEGISEEKKNELLDGAVVYMQKTLDVDPDFKEAYQLKGQSELLLKKFDDALNTLLAGIERYPDDANMWYNIGVAYANLNQKEKAEEAFSKAEALENQ